MGPIVGRMQLREVDPADDLARAAVQAFVDEVAARIPGGFDPGDPTPDEAALRRPTGAFLLATLDGVPAGCGGVRSIPRDPADPAAGDVAELKRLWVGPAHRGGGLGGRLLHDLEALARDLGHDAVRLDTHRSLGEAIAMYARHGYREIGRYNDNPWAQAFFEKTL
jgi:GNAT superfamily N-acetyltransferase